MDPSLLRRIELDACATDSITTRARARILGARDDQLRRAVRDGRWRTLHRGVLWVRPVEGPPPARVVAQAARWAAGDGLEPAGIVCGTTAAALWPLPVAVGVPELVVPDAHRALRPDLRIRQLVLPARDVTAVGDIPATTPVRTILDLARGASISDVLVLTDAALGRRLLPTTAVDELGRRLPRRLLRAAQWADGRAESPFESRVRAELLLAGLPAPALQHVITGASGRFVARVDLAWPALRLVVEADGASVHASAAALRQDVRRQNAIVDAGWRVLRFTWADLGAIAPVVARALLAAAGRAA